MSGVDTWEPSGPFIIVDTDTGEVEAEGMSMDNCHETAADWNRIDGREHFAAYEGPSQ